MLYLINLVQIITSVLSLLVLIDILLNFFMDPFNPIRRTLDSIVEPMLMPIRKILPSVGMFDFSPVVLMILIELVSRILIEILYAFR
ncbi:MAG: YggT family protein [Anaerolineales bacterium]|nr:YggT family protein [Anaerolineales bacterium]